MATFHFWLAALQALAAFLITPAIVSDNVGSGARVFCLALFVLLLVSAVGHGIACYREESL